MIVYIIVVSYNGIRWIKKCLDSCANYKVIVVDNASTDETKNIIKENHPEVILLEQKINLGFGQANNLGMNYALSQGADYVFLLNQDAYLNQNTIVELVNVLEKNKDFGILSPIHLNGEGTKLDRGFSSYLTYDSNNFFHFDAIKNNLSKLYKVHFINAAGWLIPKSTLLKIGGFDPIFFHYGEDNNYCQRLKYHELKIGLVPHVFLRHDRVFETNDVDITSMNSKEKFYKLKWGNINADYTNEIKLRVRQLKKSKYFSFLKFDLYKVKYCNKELKLIYRIVNEIDMSRSTNEKEGMHYI